MVNLEQELVGIWKEILNKDDIDTKKSVFEYGADSVNMIKCNTLLKKRLNIELDIVDLFEYESISELSDFIREKFSFE